MADSPPLDSPNAIFQIDQFTKLMPALGLDQLSINELENEQRTLSGTQKLLFAALHKAIICLEPCELAITLRSTHREFLQKQGCRLSDVDLDSANDCNGHVGDGHE